MSLPGQNHPFCNGDESVTEWIHRASKGNKSARAQLYPPRYGTTGKNGITAAVR